MKPFRNWSGSVRFTPESIAKPTSEAELCQLILEKANTGKPIRVVGTGHSFTPLIKTEGCLISLDGLQGFVDGGTHNEVWGGTKLWKLGEILYSRNLALENLGDIDQQSIAGTVSTGTHGTGKTLGSVSTQILELTLVLSDGTLLTCSNEREPEIFKAAQVALGSLGVISRLKLKTLPAYRLKLEHKRETLAECLSLLESRGAENRHFEFYSFPYSEVVQTKLANFTEEPADEFSLGHTLNALVMENGAFKVLSEISRWVPGTTRSVARLCGAGISSSKKIGWAHRVFATPRFVKFQEMEYNVPAEKLAGVLTEIREMIVKKKIRVHFPIECRYVKGDDIWLSPAFGRDSAYLAIHSYLGMPHAEYFDAAESIFRNHGGRPHWGKMHSLKAKDLRPLYPRWDDFQNIRRRLDPRGRFLTDTMKALFEA